MSLVNVDEAKQDLDPVERSAEDAAALRGWLQKNLRRSLICHFIFICVIKLSWTYISHRASPIFQNLLLAEGKVFRTSGVWWKSSRCWKCARERCFWLLQLLEHLIFFSAMSAFCVSLIVLAANMFAAWESEKITVSVGSVHHDSDLFWTSITASVTNPAETRFVKSVPVKFERASSSPPLSQWAWCDHTLTVEVRRKQGSSREDDSCWKHGNCSLTCSVGE